MKKKVVVILVVVALAVLAYFFLIAKRPVVAPTVNPSGNAEEQSNTPTSLKDLLSKGIAQSCTFNSEGSTGTIYMSGGKVRGDFDATVEGQTMKSHMIVDNNTSYIWSDGSKTGIKMSFDPNATTSPATTDTQSGSFDASTQMNYKCGAWIPDASLFALPAGVAFTSFNAPTSGESSQCSYCDSLTGDSKSQCLTALKCN
jgi:hypothetical protein